MSLDIHACQNGTYLLRGPGLHLPAAVAPPQLAGETPTLPRFEPAGTHAAAIGDVAGTVTAETAEADGLRLTRECFQSDDGASVGVRLTLTNRRDQPIRLHSLSPMRTTDPGAVRIADAAMRDWQVLRMSRQKNDIPGSYRPADDDMDWCDATFQSSDVAAGGGISAADGEANAEPVAEADPCLSIHHRDDASTPGLFLAMLGQSAHLSQFRLRRSSDRQALTEFSVVAEMDGVSVAPGASRGTHWLMMWPSHDARRDLSCFADMLAAASGAHRPGPPPTIYCSWYFYGEQLTQADLEENLAALRHKPVPFDVLVLDNGWMTDFGTWQANERFPDGMAHAAKLIDEAGYRPGIWTCPFVLMKHSPMVQKHPELVARDASGAFHPYSYKGPACCVFDPTAPGAAAYLKELYHRLVDWGYTYHKMDFLRAVPNAADARWHDRAATRAEVYRRGMGMIREAVGPDAYLQACGGIYEGSIGLVDGQRSGSDVVGTWNRPGYRTERSNMFITAKQNIFRNYMNRLWHTDPDAAMLRLRDAPLREDTGRHAFLAQGEMSQEEAFTVVANQYVSGGVVCFSERIAQLQEDRRSLLRHIIPAATGPATILDPWRADCPTLLLTEVTPRDAELGQWWTLTICNWENEPVTRTVPIETLNLPDTFDAFAAMEFRTQRFHGVMSRSDQINITVPALGTRVMRLMPWDDAPVVLGTDLHITGGGCELRRVAIHEDRIDAELDTDWDYPVMVSALFPGESGVQVVRATASPREPRISLHACRALTDAALPRA